MDAGKQMDEWVARHIFDSEEAKPYSRDLKAAWEVAERVCDQGYRLQLDGSRLWQARFYKSAAHSLATRAMAATGRTPAEAICIAALQLKGIDLPG